jgi:hypothetical protein
VLGRAKRKSEMATGCAGGMRLESCYLGLWNGLNRNGKKLNRNGSELIVLLKRCVPKGLTQTRSLSPETSNKVSATSFMKANTEKIMMIFLKPT